MAASKLVDPQGQHPEKTVARSVGHCPSSHGLRAKAVAQRLDVLLAHAVQGHWVLRPLPASLMKAQRVQEGHPQSRPLDAVVEIAIPQRQCQIRVGELVDRLPIVRHLVVCIALHLPPLLLGCPMDLRKQHLHPSQAVQGRHGFELGIRAEGPHMPGTRQATPLFVPGSGEAVALRGQVEQPAAFLEAAHSPTDALQPATFALQPTLYPLSPSIGGGCEGDAEKCKLGTAATATANATALCGRVHARDVAATKRKGGRGATSTKRS
mmetsp:Transcript_108471/g.349958  ORF Transcript_108471/g.349958 Transcript_108471/m.349958 type:complete len:266 (-) Transcript_108471:2-799(-)